MVREILTDKLFIFLCLLFVIISLSYPLTLTFDSGHYLFLADALSNQDWSKWDPIRGVIYPLFLSLFTNILGRNQNALLLPMIFAQLVLFLFSIHFILFDTKIMKRSHRKIFIALSFLLIMLDPLIMGYYHAVLTEFFAVTIAVISCYLSYKLYYLSESLPELSKPLVLSLFYYLVAIPFAWHLKQPYVGTAYFPFLLTCFLIIVRDFRKRGVFLKLLLANILIIATLGISILLWGGFLRLNGMPVRPNRELTGFFSRAYARKADTALATPLNFAKYVTKNYLALSNFFLNDREKKAILSQPSLTRAFQNQIVAYRMYEFYGQTNTFPVADVLKPHVQDFAADYFPPLWLNEIQRAQEIKSNFLFTTSYLILPLIFFFSVFFLFRMKTLSNFFVFICSGSAFLNALFHSVFLWPIDRYLFWGYPLNLIIFIICFVKIAQRLVRHRQLIV
jgi:hypothetical protein